MMANRIYTSGPSGEASEADEALADILCTAWDAERAEQGPAHQLGVSLVEGDSCRTEGAAVKNTIETSEDILALAEQVIGAGWDEQGAEQGAAHCSNDHVGMCLVHASRRGRFSV